MNLLIVGNHNRLKEDTKHNFGNLNDLVKEGKVLVLSYTPSSIDAYREELEKSTAIESFDNFKYYPFTNFCLSLNNKFSEGPKLSMRKAVTGDQQRKVISDLIGVFKRKWPEEECSDDVSKFIESYFGFLNGIKDTNDLREFDKLSDDHYEEFESNGFSIMATKKILEMYRGFKSHCDRYDFFDLFIRLEDLLKNNKDSVNDIKEKFSTIVLDPIMGLNPLFFACLGPLMDNVAVFDFDGNPKWL